MADMKAKEIVAKTLDKLAASPTIDLTQTTADGMKAAVTKEMTSVIVNQTNQEPWYQSRVTWGAIVSIAIPILGAVGVSTDVIDSDQLVALGLAAGTVIGGVITLYGRWIAKKPIGE